MPAQSEETLPEVERMHKEGGACGKEVCLPDVVKVSIKFKDTMQKKKKRKG